VAQQSIPPLGFGTFGRTGEAGVAAILYALETGYRHLDTAQSYNTEHEVGEAIRRSGLPRSEVFVTTKIDGANARRGRLIPSLERSNETLGIETVDLTLIHWPVGPGSVVDKAAVLPELAEAQARGLTRLIGVSNFTIADIEDSIAILGHGAIANNQVECHPYLQNRKLVDHCLAAGISVTCYLPIARGKLAGEPTMEHVAKKHSATVEQVALAFELAKGLCAIPTSGKAERIRSNFGGLKVKLDNEDVAAIEAVDRGTRYIDPVWGPKWDLT
jgi:2,5-diketo-D-gluconate reductase B